MCGKRVGALTENFKYEAMEIVYTFFSPWRGRERVERSHRSVGGFACHRIISVSVPEIYCFLLLLLFVCLFLNLFFNMSFLCHESTTVSAAMLCLEVGVCDVMNKAGMCGSLHCVMSCHEERIFKPSQP